MKRCICSLWLCSSHIQALSWDNRMAGSTSLFRAWVEFYSVKSGSNPRKIMQKLCFEPDIELSKNTCDTKICSFESAGTIYHTSTSNPALFLPSGEKQPDLLEEFCQFSITHSEI